MNIRKLYKKNIAKENIKLYNRRVKRTAIEITLDTIVILCVTESQSQLPLFSRSNIFKSNMSHARYLLIIYNFIFVQIFCYFINFHFLLLHKFIFLNHELHSSWFFRLKFTFKFQARGVALSPPRAKGCTNN